MLLNGSTCSTHQGVGVLWQGVVAFDPLVRGLPLPAVLLHRTQPDRTWLRERQVHWSLIATASFTATLNCSTSCTITRCWSPVYKRTNSAWTPLSRSSQAIPLSGAIARPKAVVGDLSLSSTTPSLIRCLTVTHSSMMTRWKFRQSRLTSGEPHWPSSTYTSPLRPPVLGTMQPFLTPFWRTVDTRWCSATSTPTIPPVSP